MAAKRIPLFPLGLVLLPGMQLQLHIFEERYKLMMSECLSGDKPFGIVQFDGKAIHYDIQPGAVEEKRRGAGPDRGAHPADAADRKNHRRQRPSAEIDSGQSLEVTREGGGGSPEPICFNKGVVKNKHQAVSQGVRRFGKRSLFCDR
jgi:hypothetical protein